MATSLDTFTVVSHSLQSIQADYIDADTHPDPHTVYAFVDFIAREKPGTVHWLDTLTPSRGVVLDPIRGRYSPEDGKLRTIIGEPTNERQSVTATGNPFTLAYLGAPTVGIALNADPGAVQAALEGIPAIGPGNVYVYRTVVNEKQRISFSGPSTGGAYALADASAPTVFTNGIPRNANPGTVQQALQSLAAIGPDGCSVTGAIGGPYDVEFTGARAGQNVGMLVANSAGLTPSGTVVVTEIRAGSSTAPYQVNFIGALQGTDVAQLTATGATVITSIPGDSEEGVELIANTALLDLGLDAEGNPVELLYDVVFTVPDLDPKKKDRVIGGFAITAPRVAGAVVDLATVDKLPPKAGI